MTQNEITVQEKPARLPAKPKTASVMPMLKELIANSPGNVDAVKQLIELQKDIMRTNAEIAFNGAMAELQSQLPVIKHTKKIVHKDKGTGELKVISSYTPYEDIDKIIRPIYAPLGFSFSFTSSRNDDNTVTYSGTISHVDGHFKTASMVLPADTTGAKNSIQAIGSTVSYAKRYLVTMLLNLVTEGEDDDGAKGGFTIADPLPEDKYLKLDEYFERLGPGTKETLLKYLKIEDINQIRSSMYMSAITFLKQRLPAKEIQG